MKFNFFVAFGRGERKTWRYFSFHENFYAERDFPLSFFHLRWNAGIIAPNRGLLKQWVSSNYLELPRIIRGWELLRYVIFGHAIWLAVSTQRRLQTADRVQNAD